MNGSEPPAEGSAWGLSTPGAAPEEGPLATPEAVRYHTTGRLGAGGMGVVDAVHDQRLDRAVARKRPAPGLAPGLGEVLLAHEARVTARLDHPNIVPVHDAGVGPDGQPYVTLRLLPGRTLDALLDDPQRPPLPRRVRHVLDAARGVAHAHDRGVVHADLKPANLLVGEHGETWVADWGLAHELDGHGPPVAAGAGTPPFRAPEVEAGAAPRPPSDVYALGRVLDRVAGGEADEELLAIVHRATAPSPRDRYASAGDLAEDLEAWLDGRRVSAHVYSPWALLRRLVHAWRGRLIVAGVVVTLLAAALASGARRTALERDRAREAERALARTAAALWADRAAQALAQGEDRAAREAAEAALALHPAPGALGVLAALGPEPVRGPLVPLPGCTRVARLDADGALCGDGTTLLRLDDAGEVLARWPVAATDAVPVAGDAVVALVAGRPVRLRPDRETVEHLASPGLAEEGLVASPEGLLSTRMVVSAPGAWGADLVTPCPPRDTLDAIASTAEGGWWGVCSGGDLVRGSRTGAAPVRGHGAGLADTMALVAVPGAGTLVAGRLAGDVVLLGIDGQELARLDAGVGAIRHLAVAGDGETAAVVGFDGRVRLVRPRDGAWLASPGVPGARQAAWRDDHRLLLLTPDGLVHVPDALGAPLTRLVLPDGLSAAARSDDGTLAAVASGGDVLVLDPTAGRVRVRFPQVHTRTIKGLAFDGTRVVSGAVDDEGALAWLGPAAGEVDRLAQVQRLRRVVRTQAGHLLAASWMEALIRLPSGTQEPARLPLARPVADLVVPRAAPGAWALDEDGRVLRVAEDGVVTAVLQVDTAARLAVAADGGRVALVTPVGVQVWQTAPPTLLATHGVADVTALGLDAHGDTLALGHLDGTVAVWQVGEHAPRWTARGHRARVGALLLGEDGALLTAGWDGLLRRWSAEGVPPS
ncbi:MAG: protein kinase [Alphaproteobacteria bacterium]|nr:protein kinase [Alphaproteobacteria bacterium]